MHEVRDLPFPSPAPMPLTAGEIESETRTRMQERAARLAAVETNEGITRETDPFLDGINAGNARDGLGPMPTPWRGRYPLNSGCRDANPLRM